MQGTPIPYTYFENVGSPRFPLFLPVTLPTTTTIDCDGQDTVNVGDPSNGLQDIFGTLNIYSPQASASVNLNVDDHETTYVTPCAVSIANTSITGTSVSDVGLGQAAINYGVNNNGTVDPGGVSELTVKAGKGGTTFTVGDMTGGPATVNLSALGTGNSIVGPNTSVTWTFQTQKNSPLDDFKQGSNASTVYFAGIGAITGGSGSNFFMFIQTGFNGSIDGGPSGDSTLDFGPYGGSSLSVETTEDGSLNGVQGTATEGTSFNNIDALLGDPSVDCVIGNATFQNETYQGNFTHTLTVSGFEQMVFNFAGNFSGELLASTEGVAALVGTPNNPDSTINVTGTIEACAMIKVGFLLYLTVEGDMDGIIKGFGDDSSVPTIQYVTIDGTVGSGAQIVARSLRDDRREAGPGGHPQRKRPPGIFRACPSAARSSPPG